jgi:hypothetical protein
MISSALFRSNALSRVIFKSLAFVFLWAVAIFCASAGYGLLKVLIQAMGRGESIGIAEFATHSGLTITFFLSAGLGAYLAKNVVGMNGVAHGRTVQGGTPARLE